MVPRNLSIVDTPFLAGLGAVVASIITATWVFGRRHWWRWPLRALALLLVPVVVAACINAHFDYFPTLGALLGRNAADQISAQSFRRLEDAAMHARRANAPRGRSRPVPVAVRLPSHGVVISFVIPPALSHFAARTAEVYLPPAWFRVPRPHLPVIELLHGAPGSPPDWTRGGMADLTADTFASAHDGYAPVLVMPDVNGRWWNDSECVDGPRGNAETYLVDDVRNAIVDRLATREDAGGWAVAGLSEGGSCALQIGLRHPDRFSVVGDFSGDDHPWVSGGLRDLFWGRTSAQLAYAERSYDPRVLLATWHGQRAPAIFFAAGRADGTLVKMTHLLALARRDGMDATLYVLHGSHTFWVWREAFQAAMPWIAARLTDPPWPPDTRRSRV